MILVYGKNPVGNVIHAIIGPESEIWSELHGSLTVDITPLLSICDEDAPVLLNISKCKSELMTAHQIQVALANGAQYPFLPGTAVFAPQLQAANTEAKDAAAPKTMEATTPQIKPKADSKAKTQKATARKVDLHRGKCSRCPDEDAELIPGLKPAICFNCARIDLYMARKDQPLGNPGVIAQEPPADVS